MTKNNAVHYADWDEMVFAQKEKSYGAFLLRQRYHRNLAFSVGLASALFLGSTLGPLWWQKLRGEDVASLISRTHVIASTIQPPDLSRKKVMPITRIKLPPRPPKSLAFHIPTPTPEDEHLEDFQTIHNVDTLMKAPTIGLVDQEEGSDEIIFLIDDVEEGDIPEVIGETGEPAIDEWIIPDEEPTPINMAEIHKLISYPKLARESSIEGMVVVRMLVDERGNYSKHRVINSPHPLLSREIERHLHKLRFTPAIQGKQPIAFWVNIPFHFHLMD